MKRKITLFLVLLLVICTCFANYLSISAIGLILIVQFYYTFFYTKQPRQFWFVVVVGIGLAGLNWYYPSPHSIVVFSILTFLECFRVVVMAVLRYPATIRNLRDMTEDLERRVGLRTVELQDANEKLLRANEELRELDQMKSAFVSQASHDLRTPLAAIKGSLDNLTLGVAGELTEKQQRVLERATRSVDRLTDLINDVLDLSRIESGRIVLEKSDVSLRAIVESVVQENRPAAEQKRISIITTDMTDSFRINIDGGKIQRVAGEFIGNAIKYTPEGGTIETGVSRTDKMIALFVKDSGIGMTPKERGKIWDRFYRTAASQHIARGSGLGLSIAKELVELHGGSITVDSEEGKGTTFTMFLPA